MQKIGLILIIFLILSIGLQNHFIKVFGLPTALSYGTIFLAFILSIKSYFRLTSNDLIIFSIVAFLIIRMLATNENHGQDIAQAGLVFIIVSKLLYRVHVRDTHIFASITYLSSVFVVIGVLQFMKVSFVLDIQPLMNSSFVGSGGVAGISLSRPNLALGNSLNTGLFCILNILLILANYHQYPKFVRAICLSLFIFGVLISLSRSAAIQLFILAPLIIAKLGFSISMVGALVFFTAFFDNLSLFFQRFVNKDFTQASNSERAQALFEFIRNMNIESFIIGRDDFDRVKISDSLFLHSIDSIGFFLGCVFIFEIFRVRQRYNWRSFTYCMLILVSLVSILFTNSYLAHYNLVILCVILHKIKLQYKVQRL